ncbi:uncharacterized protein STEHIDRAFT_160003 [Stereum hirsutum FP-91666 SS1]|uniref:uncharacterized protein n=1 Tax=Stereum hirsutum (strain FP-91666) TaxID=721885 RepID=UPI0004449DAF|nr:uncharacterized protein STEHIDRAFT_160003 [Stereum hirsutum FP-91666 SS1]EIM83423.1 hypothetical protein STEHIDRAFT_160003 [Stereum hirsutum FP-91666 SS1]
MADDAIPSISTGSVGSRFVSQTDLETAKARREEQWKAAYARLGQEPPPQQQEEIYDGRSLAEAAKQEEWEEKTKLANQFRALEEDEIMFLDSVREQQEEEERQRKERDGEEVRGFREAIASRVIVKSPPIAAPAASPPIDSASASKPSATNISPTTFTSSIVKKPAPTVAAKKDSKKPLKGVVMKKKPKPAGAKPASSKPVETKPKDDAGSKPDLGAKSVAKTRTAEGEDEDRPEAKRRKVGGDS